MDNYITGVLDSQVLYELHFLACYLYNDKCAPKCAVTPVTPQDKVIHKVIHRLWKTQQINTHQINLSKRWLYATVAT